MDCLVRVFMITPLTSLALTPLSSLSLAVHVNGCFELSASRTALSWHEYARKDHWNRHVLAAVVSRAYVHLLLDCQPLGH